MKSLRGILEVVPLSEQERKILEEIERNLYVEDPSFAREVKRSAPRMKDRRRVKLGIFVFVLGFVGLFGFFISGSLIVGLAAFAAMVGGIMMVAGSFKASIAPRRPPGPNLKQRVNDGLASFEEKMRDRRRR